MAELILFDDNDPMLAPVCDLRASFELRTGAVTTAERLVRQLAQSPTVMVAPPAIAPLVAARHHLPVNRAPEVEVLLLNGRWTSMDHEPPDRINCALVANDGSVLAGLLDAGTTAQFIEDDGRLPDGVHTTVIETTSLLRHPWDVLRCARANLVSDIEAMTHLKPFDPPAMVVVIGHHGVRIGRGAVVDPMTVFDTSGGPVAIDAEAHIAAHCVLEGPCFIGRGATVNARAHIRANTVIGPICKVGGEVGGCVFQSFSNKAHAGYLGDSYVGEWVNLGAGTTTSNLKNTYGQVKMQTAADAEPQPTGMQFLGTIFGDHVKTAIGTRLLTGSCLGTGAMVALGGFAPKYVPPFAFVTDDGATRYDLERFCVVADRVMQRRGRRVTAEVAQALAALHARGTT